MELDLQRFLGSCVQLSSLAETSQPPSLPPDLGSYTRALLVSQDRRHLCVTPWVDIRENKTKIKHNFLILHNRSVCLGWRLAISTVVFTSGVFRSPCAHPAFSRPTPFILSLMKMNNSWAKPHANVVFTHQEDKQKKASKCVPFCFQQYYV